MNLLDYFKQSEIGQKRISLKKGESLAKEGDPCLGVYWVERGKVKVVSYSLSGREVIYNLLSQGDAFGNNLVFSSEPYFKGDVIAESEASLFYLAKDALLRLLKTNEPFLLEYLRIQSDFGKKLNGRIKLLSFDSAKERLLYHLQTHKGRIVFTSVSSLASELGLQRETLSRLLSQLEKEGILGRKGKTIVLVDEV